MPNIIFDKCYEYVWVNDSTQFVALKVDSMALKNDRDALGNSTLVAKNQTIDKAYKFDKDWQGASVTVVLLCLFCFVVGRFSRPITQLIKNSFSIETTLALIYNPSRDFNKFIETSKYLAILALIVIAESFAELSFDFTQLGKLIAFASFTVIIIATFILKNIIRKIAAFVSESQNFFENIKFVEDCNIALMSIIMAPVAIAVTFVDVIKIPIICALSIMYIYHIYRLYLVIGGKKFSFMQWFLYLCGAEWMPIGVIIAAITIVNTIVLS